MLNSYFADLQAVDTIAQFLFYVFLIKDITRVQLYFCLSSLKYVFAMGGFVESLQKKKTVHKCLG